MFKGFRTETEVRYLDVINENAGRQCAIYKVIDRIYEMYGKYRAECRGLKVLAGDQPTFKAHFWIFYEGMENGTNDLFKWVIPITGGFHDEKKAIIDTLQWAMGGNMMESFLEDSELSPSQCENFSKFEYARINRRFLCN